MNHDLKILLRALKGESLDWYFAHHGFEERWIADAELLRNAYFDELADVLSKAGPIHDKWEAIRTSRDDGEMTQREEKQYGEEMIPLDDRVTAFFDQATHLDVGSI